MITNETKEVIKVIYDLCKLVPYIKLLPEHVIRNAHYEGKLTIFLDNNKIDFVGVYKQGHTMVLSVHYYDNMNIDLDNMPSTSYNIGHYFESYAKNLQCTDEVCIANNDSYNLYNHFTNEEMNNDAFMFQQELLHDPDELRHIVIGSAFQEFGFDNTSLIIKPKFYETDINDYKNYCTKLKQLLSPELKKLGIQL